MSEPYTWSVIGGIIDEGEDAFEAALREFSEETEFDGDYLYSKELHVHQSDKITYTIYHLVIASEFEPVLNWESISAEWFEYGDWPNPLHYGMEELIEVGKL